MTACETGRMECPDCHRPRCCRCGGCCERVPADAPGTFDYYCPSWTCALAKKLSRLAGRPYRRSDTPDDA